MNKENRDKAPTGKTIYDGLKISEHGADIIVFSLSLILLICFIIAFISSK